MSVFYHDSVFITTLGLAGHLVNLVLRMRKWKFLVITLVATLLLAGIMFFLLGFKKSDAKILVDSSPAASVFLDGVQTGRTPYEGTYKPGEVTVKLIPQSGESWETKINLVSGIKTIVRRTFGEAEDTSAGEVISFEKESSKLPTLSVVSMPDSATVTVDGQVKGFSPVKITKISEGEHQLIISADGYDERIFSVKTLNGYRLTAVVKLAAKPAPSPTPLLSVTEKFIEILPTPTGFLRVREEATIGSREIGQVKPGQKYKVVLEDEKSGWIQIEFDEGKMGWISKEYVKEG